MGRRVRPRTRARPVRRGRAPHRRRNPLAVLPRPTTRSMATGRLVMSPAGHLDEERRCVRTRTDGHQELPWVVDAATCLKHRLSVKSGHSLLLKSVSRGVHDRRRGGVRNTPTPNLPSCERGGKPQVASPPWRCRLARPHISGGAGRLQEPPPDSSRLPFHPPAIFPLAGGSLRLRLAKLPPEPNSKHANTHRLRHAFPDR